MDAAAAAALAAENEALRRSVAFLLDIDGTLVFTDHLYFRVFQKLLTPYGSASTRPSTRRTCSERWTTTSSAS